MAASLVARAAKALSLLTIETPVNIQSVRELRRRSGFNIRRRRPVKPWFDPKDQSWAEPILQHEVERDSQPEPEPSMLHMVYRIKDTYPRPYWEKEVLRELGLIDKAYKPVVLKNTPEINQKLHQIKHLIRIKPVIFPYGLPKDEQDFKHCFLNENGEFIVKHRINNQSATVQEAWAQVKMREESEEKDVWTLQWETVKKDCEWYKERYMISSEYFPEKYVYKYNEDGKEDRYKGNHNIGRHRQDWH